MKRSLIGIVAAVGLIVCMTAVATASGRHEVFFPEVLALAMGCLVMPKRPWNVTPLRLFLTMTVGAWLGWGLLQVSGVPVSLRMLLGFFLCGCWLFLAGTNMVPMLSACLLPLMLGRASVVYSLAISCLTLLLLLLEQGLIGTGIKVAQPYVSMPCRWRPFLCRWLLLTLLLGVLLVPALALGGFWGVPPLVVGFTAFADMKRPARRQFFMGVLVFCLAAVSGALGAWAVYVCPAVPRCLMAGVLSGVFLLVCHRLSYFLPPSGAVLLLPFLMPGERLWLYGCQVPVGSLCFLAAGRLFSWAEERYGHHDGQK